MTRTAVARKETRSTGDPDLVRSDDALTDYIATACSLQPLQHRPTSPHRCPIRRLGPTAIETHTHNVLDSPELRRQRRPPPRASRLFVVVVVVPIALPGFPSCGHRFSATPPGALSSFGRLVFHFQEPPISSRGSLLTLGGRCGSSGKKKRLLQLPGGQLRSL
ncbi:hypothetical protein MRX96_018694 [Rhipicephalus microplus]